MTFSSERPRHGCRPLLSVLIPAFQAESGLLKAVKSCLDSKPGAFDLQIVVAPDDGADYRGLLSRNFGSIDRIRVVAGEFWRTGPGATRNRALAAADGDYIFALDADDEICSSFFALAMEEAQRFGVCSAGLIYMTPEGQALRRVYPGAVIAANEIVDGFASTRFLMQRDLCSKWAVGCAEDVAHDLASILSVGGRCPNIPDSYVLHLNEGSICTRPEIRMREGYARLLQAVSHEPAVFGFDDPKSFAVLKHMVAERMVMSTRYEQASIVEGPSSYHRFIVLSMAGAGNDLVRAA